MQFRKEGCLNLLKGYLVGFGNMGQNYFRVLKNHPDFQITHIVDNKWEKNMIQMSENSIILHDIPLNVSADFAILCSPSAYHFEHAKFFINKRIPVLIEKPIATTRQDVVEIISYAEMKNSKVFCSFPERYNPILRYLNKIDYESMHKIEFRRLSPKPAKIQSDVILDLAIHDIDILINIMKLNILKITPPTSYFSNKTQFNEVVAINGNFGQHNMFSISASRLSQYKVREIILTGEHSQVLLNLFDKSVEITRNSKDTFDEFGNYGSSSRTEKIVFNQKYEPLFLQMNEFKRNINSGNNFNRLHLSSIIKTHNLVFDLFEMI